jgi:hypothetical protein
MLTALYELRNPTNTN